MLRPPPPPLRWWFRANICCFPPCECALCTAWTVCTISFNPHNSAKSCTQELAASMELSKVCGDFGPAHVIWVTDKVGENPDTGHGCLSLQRHYPELCRTKSTSLPTLAYKPSGPGMEIFKTEKQNK